MELNIFSMYTLNLLKLLATINILIFHISAWYRPTYTPNFKTELTDGSLSREAPIKD